MLISAVSPQVCEGESTRRHKRSCTQQTTPAFYTPYSQHPGLLQGCLFRRLKGQLHRPPQTGMVLFIQNSKAVYWPSKPTLNKECYSQSLHPERLSSALLLLYLQTSKSLFNHFCLVLLPKYFFLNQ